METAMSKTAERVVSMLYDKNNKLFGITVSVSETYVNYYDVDYCKSGQGYYHCSGAGPWDRSCQEIHQTTLREIVDRLDLFEGEVIWCSVCEDWLPVDEVMCKHIRWDNDDGLWVGEGVL